MKTNIIENIIKLLLNTEGVNANDATIAKAAAWALGKTKVDMAAMQPAFLQPITETLGNSGAVSKHYFLPQALTLLKGEKDTPLFFPKTEKPNDTQLTDYVKTLETGITSWASLDYYGSSIACDKPFSDVSLFDFVKTTTALTDILTQGENMVIVCGNVSGIQTYIYDIISRSAAKNMKGRSFYVQLLTETILQLTLDKMGLKSFHVLYASGGGFYILAPTDKVLIEKTIDNIITWVETEDFSTLRQDINKVLRDEHGLSLSFDLLHSDIIKPEDQDFSTKWTEIFKRGEKAKMRRHAAALNTKTYNEFFKPHEIGGEQERDVITNEEFKKGERVEYVDREKTLPIRKITLQQIELGRALKKADYWTITRNSLNRANGEFQLYNWNVYHNFSDKQLTVSSSNLISQRVLNTPSVKTDFTYYGGNDVPRYDKDNLKDDVKVGDPKFFEDLAQGIDFDRLGILRMDVDNLGSKIQSGIAEPCFARLSALSRSLDYFFKGFLNTLWSGDEADAEVAKYKNRKDFSFILYSGGDDLFILGRWDVIMSFALDIQKYFTDWVCKNPELTISGGVVLVPSKFPIVQAAALAKVAEKKAKEHEREGKEKNAFCFLNMPLDWDYELKLVQYLKTKLITLLKQGSISKSLLDKINSYASARKAQQDNKKTERWRWIMAYDLTRYSQTLKDDDAKLFVQQLYTAATTNSDLSFNGKIKSKYTFIEILQIAARWAEFDYRTEK